MNRLMKKLKKMIIVTFVGMTILQSLPNNGLRTVKAAEPVVIVIDPGHGGDNLGTDYLSIPEKTYTLVIANYMKQELETYDNVTVYMTRTTDTSLSLEQRAAFAKSVDADFLYSLHLNESISHILYGAEVWVPSQGALYSQAASFGTEMLKEFSTLGIYNRGVKTKVNSKNTDYYGIIRGCTTRGIPSCIIEHCHVDHPKDASYYASQEALKQLGVADATAVAKYFNLKSSKAGKDYSNYAVAAIPTPSTIVYQDKTAPEIAQISLQSNNKGTKQIGIMLQADDSNGFVQMYRYSTNGGNTWSDLIPWNPYLSSATVTIPVTSGNTYHVVFEVYNQYDIKTQSNSLTVTAK